MRNEQCQIHLLGCPHTITSAIYSSCAFTAKILKLTKMAVKMGWPMTHYGNGLLERQTPTVLHIPILSQPELEEHVGVYDPAASQQIGVHSQITSPLYVEFNRRLAIELDLRVKPNDLILLPFGYAHHKALQDSTAAKAARWIESGIGYSDSFCQFRVFESHCWYNWTIGKEFGRDSNRGYNGSDYWTVINNFFDLDEFTPCYEKGRYVLYFGRLNSDKGLPIVCEIAKHRPDLHFIICGQGDPTPWLQTPNIEYKRPVMGVERDKLLGGAIAVLCPSRYLEPFCGVAVEAILCGRIPIVSGWGGMVETVPEWLRMRTATLKDWLDALASAEAACASEYKKIADYARSRFDMHVLAKDYDRYFDQVADLQHGGWYQGT